MANVRVFPLRDFVTKFLINLLSEGNIICPLWYVYFIRGEYESQLRKNGRVIYSPRGNLSDRATIPRAALITKEITGRALVRQSGCVEALVRVSGPLK